ncbi:hypothetical protein [Streptomyces sp. NPDC059874]|uniref:hypothetical protein n=1 Tax=Streptomyces sp. NPDC059874 TaxID=3346983 RepID=UPI00364B6BFA
MGYNLASVTLRFEGREINTVKWVTDVLTSLNYAYDVAAVAYFMEHQGVGDSQAHILENILEGTAEAGLSAAVLSIEPMLEEGAKLKLENLTTGHSFEINVTGVAEVVDSLAKVIDPARRADFKEDAKKKQGERQHQAEMNKTEEAIAKATAELQVLTINNQIALEALKGFREVVKEYSNLHNQLVESFGEENANKLLEKFAAEYARSLGLLPVSEIKVIEGPK